MDTVRVSKTLSLWLRHQPRLGGLTLDEEGWAEVPAVLAALERTLRRPVSLADLEAVVAENDKQRFTIADGLIRANQGHSLPVQLRFEVVTPPAALYHGTTRERWVVIQRSGGLAKMRRHHVHLSPDKPTAQRVAGRHRGQQPILLRVDAARMVADGRDFFISANGVYLVDAVPLAYLTVAD